MTAMQSPYDTDITELEKIIGETKTRLAMAKQQRADYICPYKVGQLLVNSKGRQAQVATIKSARWNSRGYDVTGYYILKNGELGTVRHELYHIDGWVAV